MKTNQDVPTRLVSNETARGNGIIWNNTKRLSDLHYQMEVQTLRGHLAEIVRRCWRKVYSPPFLKYARETRDLI